uniref:Anaphase-promoting complex subunit 1 n=1 Tax=Alexandrium monilatum TaxID=311494 RepID=A0A7S4W007_9DINO
MTGYTSPRKDVWLAAALLMLHRQLPVEAALNVGAHDAGDLVTALRRSIFVETAYLSERREERCSSLDGPRCLAAMLSGGGPTGGGGGAALQRRPSSVLDGPGVLPDLLLHDLGVDKDLTFVTPEYSVLDAARQQHASSARASAVPVLSGVHASTLLHSARESAQSGILHFAELIPDARVPLSFSRGLPGNIVATWDGKWLVHSCSQDFPALAVTPVQKTLALPAPDVDSTGTAAPPSPVARGLDTQHGSSTVCTVARLTSSLGYLRFSAPVLVRSLFARWRPRTGAPAALVGGRLGLHGVWTTHLDPKKLGGRQGWVDISDGTLRPVDELAFVATVGLEVGAVEVVAHGGGGDEDEEHSVLLLAPRAGGEGGEGGDAEQAAPGFDLRMERFTKALAPYIVSLQEAIDRNLRLRAAPAARGGAYIPGLLTPRSPALSADEDNATWYATTAANQAMFDHTSLMQLLLAHTLRLPGAGEAMASLLDLLSGSSPALPRDLQRELPQEFEEIGDALEGFLGAGGGWGHGTPPSLPSNSTDGALLSYLTAKRWQTKLDLLTAAYLHQPTPGMSMSGVFGHAMAALLPEER